MKGSSFKTHGRNGIKISIGQKTFTSVLSFHSPLPVRSLKLHSYRLTIIYIHSFDKGSIPSPLNFISRKLEAKVAVRGSIVCTPARLTVFEAFVHVAAAKGIYQLS